MGLMIGIEIVHPGTTDHASKLAYKVCWALLIPAQGDSE